ncbi:MAG: SDR family NAD(P)-dependent oxidoreductase, partial [Alistipes sp.]|nr:SDR family NAD(P)-dependent oxidoreductase [Alistipes sp.]
MRRGEVIVGSAWAVVTGAGSGIGRCYALRLADLGYDVVLVGQEERNLRETQRDISRSYDVEVRCITLDLARLEAAEELHDRIEEAGLKVDVLINNAGIFSFRDVLKMDGQKMERMLLLHTMTTTKLCRLFAADM